MACVLMGAAASLAAPKQKSGPKVGSCYEMQSHDKEYLKGYQVVGVIDPQSPSRLAVDPVTDTFVGPRFKGAPVWWVDKRADKRTKTGRLPFKVRLLRYNPAGVLQTLHQQGKVQLYGAQNSNGEMAYSVKLARPKPWWKKLV
eukprot:CAMPEP_0119358064 /NCGR_PEP_ID=MMETSP1334-20130426/6353_1 /TAXON_ID=127549 /ORGANISM="Calcidiscus leptoporus, Strain RCC1130" /LENGTH=142 /DNA_ID=CAMNT_0007372471 /DNA_START=50 /DNA_END=478 /DNA_ORIENTATION=-